MTLNGHIRPGKTSHLAENSSACKSGPNFPSSNLKDSLMPLIFSCKFCCLMIYIFFYITVFWLRHMTWGKWPLNRCLLWNTIYIFIFLDCYFPWGSLGAGAGIYPSCIWAKTGLIPRALSKHLWVQYLEGTSAVLWRSPGTFQLLSTTRDWTKNLMLLSTILLQYPGIKIVLI